MTLKGMKLLKYENYTNKFLVTFLKCFYNNTCDLKKLYMFFFF
jgi:hypothetical protein